MGYCPKNQFWNICQIVRHSTKEYPFNMKTKGHQQVLLMQEASTLGAGTNTNNDVATLGGYWNNNRRGWGGNNNNNNNNGGCSRIQYDPTGRPIIQCRACNLWGHSPRHCTTKETPQLLCRWCGPGDHKDSKCPKPGVNLLTIERCEEEALVITCAQAKKAIYTNSKEEKKRMQQAKTKIEKEMEVKKLQMKDSRRNQAKQNIIRQVMQARVPMKLNDLLIAMPQLRTAILNMTPSPKAVEEPVKNTQGGSGTTTIDPMLLALNTRRHPVVVEMGIHGTILTDTVVDEGSSVNVLPEETWKKLGQPTYPMAAYIPTAHYWSTRNQTPRNSNGATRNNRNTTLLTWLCGHSVEIKRLRRHPRKGLAAASKGETWTEKVHFVHGKRRS